MLILFFGCSMLQAAVRINPDNKLPFNYRANSRDAWSNIYVFAQIYPNVNYTVRSAGLLSKLQKEFRSKNVTVNVLIKSSGKALEDFVANFPEWDFTVTADPESKIASRLYRSKKDFPECSIFNHAGKILWSGSPLDLEMMLKKITSGQYSEREEIRISALAASLQAALRSGDPRTIIQSADQLLAARPEQLSAVNAKAYALEISGDIAGLEKFFRSRIKRFPDDTGNYIMLLEAALRLPPLQRQAPALAREFIKTFPNDAENINAVAWSLLTNLAFDAEAFSAACHAVRVLEKHPRANSSRVLTTRALIAYRKCDLAKAVTLIKRAQIQTNSISEKAMLSGLEKYFNQIKVEK